MAGNPNLIGGGRMTRAEVSGDKRRFEGATLSRGKLLRRLWRYLGRNRVLLVLALLLSLTSSLLALYGPKLSGTAINAIDLGEGKVDFDTVIRCAVLMVIFYITAAGLTYLLNIVMIRLSRRVSRQMRHDVFERLSALPVSYFDRFQTGDIISTITYDVDTVNQSLSTDLLQILKSVVMVTVSFIMMLSIAPVLVIIFVFTVPITFIFTRWLAGRVRPLFRRRSAKLGQLNGFVEEMLSGQKTIRSYGREDAVLEEFDKKNNAAVEAYTVAEIHGTITGPSVNCINNLSLALVCVFGAVFAGQGGPGRFKLLRAVFPEILRPHQRDRQHHCGIAKRLRRGRAGVHPDRCRSRSPGRRGCRRINGCKGRCPLRAGGFFL